MSKPKASIIFIGLLSAFSLLTFDLYQPSLSYIKDYFDTTPNLSQLSLSIYLFTFGVSQLFWGPLIDHYGRRRLLPSCLMLSTLASLLCALAPNIWILIIGRALQGVFLCCVNLVAFSVSRDFEDAVERAKVLSYISMIVSVSPILAPVVGSIFFIYFGWQSNFILMTVIGFVLFLQTRRALLESPFWTAPTKSIDLKRIAQSYQSILPLKTLWCGAFIMMFSFASVIITIISSSYLIIDILGFSPFGFGIIFIFNGLNIILGNYIGIWLRGHFNMGLTIYIGNMCIILGGLAMLILYNAYGFSLPVLSLCLIVNLGISISAPPTMSLCLSEHKETTGIALAIIHTLRMFGSFVLAVLVGYLLMIDLVALPLSLIFCGVAALFFSWQFNQSTALPEDTDFGPAEAAS